MAEKTTQVAEKKESFGAMLSDRMDLVQDAIPKNFNKTRFVQNCISLLNDDYEKYTKYKKEVILANLMKGAYLGLDFFSGEAYLVPFGNTLTFMPSYIGNVKLAKKYSIRPIKDIYSKVIRNGDEFEEVITNGEPSINFKPKFLNDGEIIGAFAVVIYQDGGMGYEVMSKADIENTRKSSKAKNSPAWTNFYSEMAKKTVMKRLCKHIDLELSADQQTIYNEDMAIETDPQKINEIEVEAEANTVDFMEFEGEQNE